MRKHYYKDLRIASSLFDTHAGANVYRHTGIFRGIYDPLSKLLSFGLITNGVLQTLMRTEPK